MGTGEENENGKNGGANGMEVKRKRTSTVMEKEEPMEQPVPKKRGPPPPKLPELRGVSREGKEEGGLGGGDMFANIR